VGLKKHVKILHAEASSELSTPKSPVFDAASASELAALRAEQDRKNKEYEAKLEAQAQEYERMKREHEAMKKTANLKDRKDPPGGGGTGRQVQLNANDEAHMDGIRAAVLSDVFRDPRMIRVETQVQHLAAARPEEEQRRAAAHADDKAALFGNNKGPK
jgi:hypothetical protein